MLLYFKMLIKYYLFNLYLFKEPITILLEVFTDYLQTADRDAAHDARLLRGGTLALSTSKGPTLKPSQWSISLG